MNKIRKTEALNINTQKDKWINEYINDPQLIND